jgi:hypothetical protein
MITLFLYVLISAPLLSRAGPPDCLLALENYGNHSLRYLRKGKQDYDYGSDYTCADYNLVFNTPVGNYSQINFPEDNAVEYPISVFGNFTWTPGAPGMGNYSLFYTPTISYGPGNNDVLFVDLIVNIDHNLTTGAFNEPSDNNLASVTFDYYLVPPGGPPTCPFPHQPVQCIWVYTSADISMSTDCEYACQNKDLIKPTVCQLRSYACTIPDLPTLDGGPQLYYAGVTAAIQEQFSSQVELFLAGFQIGQLFGPPDTEPPFPFISYSCVDTPSELVPRYGHCDGGPTTSESQSTSVYSQSTSHDSQSQSLSHESNSISVSQSLSALHFSQSASASQSISISLPPVSVNCNASSLAFFAGPLLTDALPYQYDFDFYDYDQNGDYSDSESQSPEPTQSPSQSQSESNSLHEERGKKKRARGTRRATMNGVRSLGRAISTSSDRARSVDRAARRALLNGTDAVPPQPHDTDPWLDVLLGPQYMQTLYQYVAPPRADPYTYGYTMSVQNNCGLHIHVVGCSANTQVWIRPSVSGSAELRDDPPYCANNAAFSCAVVTKVGPGGSSPIILLTDNVYIDDSATNIITGGQEFDGDYETTRDVKTYQQMLTVLRFSTMLGPGCSFNLSGQVFGFEIPKPDNSPEDGYYFRCDKGEELTGFYNPLFEGTNYCQSNSSFGISVVQNWDTSSTFPVKRNKDIVEDAQFEKNLHFFATPQCPQLTICPDNGWYFDDDYLFIADYVGPAYALPTTPLNTTNPFATGSFDVDFTFAMNDTDFLNLLADVYPLRPFGLELIYYMQINLFADFLGQAGDYYQSRPPRADELFPVLIADVLLGNGSTICVEQICPIGAPGRFSVPANMNIYYRKLSVLEGFEALTDGQIDTDDRGLTMTHYKFGVEIGDCLLDLYNQVNRVDPDLCFADVLAITKAQVSFYVNATYGEELYDDYFIAHNGTHNYAVDGILSKILIHGFAFNFTTPDNPSGEELLYVPSNQCERAPSGVQPCQGGVTPPSPTPVPSPSASPSVETNECCPREHKYGSVRREDQACPWSPPPTNKDPITPYGNQTLFAEILEGLDCDNGALLGCDPLAFTQEDILPGGIYQLRDYRIAETPPSTPFRDLLMHLGVRIGGIWLSFSDVFHPTTDYVDVKLYYTPGHNVVRIAGVAFGRIHNGYCIFQDVPSDFFPQRFSFELSIESGLLPLYGAGSTLAMFIVRHANPSSVTGKISPMDYCSGPCPVLTFGLTDLNHNIVLPSMMPTIDALTPLEMMIGLGFPNAFPGIYSILVGLQVDCSDAPTNLTGVSPQDLFVFLACLQIIPYAPPGMGLLMADIEALCNNCEPQPTPGICPIHNTTHGTQSQSQPQYGDNYGEDGYGGGGGGGNHHHSTNTQSASETLTPRGGDRRDGDKEHQRDAQQVVFPGLGQPIEAGTPSNAPVTESWRHWSTFLAMGVGAFAFVGILVALIYHMRQAHTQGTPSKSIIISQSDGGAILLPRDTHGRVVRPTTLPNGSTKYNEHQSDWVASGSEGEDEDDDDEDTGMQVVQLSTVTDVEKSAR